VSGIVTLTLRAPLAETLDVAELAADRLARRTEHDIAALPVWAGRREARLGDFFSVSGGSAATIRIVGDVTRVRGLAAGQAAGEIVVEGDVGDDVACGMRGGSLHVKGNAGDRLAAAAPGAAKGMIGGEVVIEGSAGGEAAARARRGLVVIGGDVGTQAGRAMIAGSLIVLGRVGGDAGRHSKRGSILAVGGVPVPSTYRYACTYRPPHVRLTMTYLRRRYGLSIDDRITGGRYRRYCGDAGDPGKGEILEWASE
jgi:formylmethanofuran dehydrogenase subunit C